ncbi:unnamed protein product, partial [marine sediment metagenome]
AFIGWEVNGELVGVMGFESVKNVTLIRHAYVLPQWQKQGIGSKLLNYLKDLVTNSRLLVGTWADAYWAVDFYKKHGFNLLPDKDALLKIYWGIPQRQIETSVVLGDGVRVKKRKEMRNEMTKKIVTNGRGNG